MRLSSDDYIEAARERLHAARVTYDRGRYVDSLYLSGVATECLLRAYAGDGPAFDRRHDLVLLLTASSLFEQLPNATSRRAVQSALGEVWSRWKNGYRYAPERRLRSETRRLRLDRGVRGDPLKERALRTFENAFILIRKGIEVWKPSSKT